MKEEALSEGISPMKLNFHSRTKSLRTTIQSNITPRLLNVIPMIGETSCVNQGFTRGAQHFGPALVALSSVRAF